MRKTRYSAAMSLYGYIAGPKGAGGLAAALKAKPGKDIWLMGEGSLVSNLLEMGMVHTVEVAVIPVFLGRESRCWRPWRREPAWR